MQPTRLAAALFVTLVLTSAAVPAGAETINCTPIATVPAVISLPGLYCFTKSFTTVIASGNLIDIQASNVVLDMNGHRLGGLGAGLGTTAIGIHAASRQNITIRNGTIRGFLAAISIVDPSGTSQGHLIEDIRADQNTYGGLQIVGTGNIIRNNQVIGTGGTTAFGPNRWGFGIYVSGTGTRVLNNDVISTTSTGTLPSYAIYFALNDGGFGTGGLAASNRMTDADFGIYFDTGIAGKYRDNLTSDVATPYTSGTDAGNNN